MSVKIISVANNKGGVSKTTTACSLAYCMAQRGEKVLLVDMDSQGNTTKTYGLTHKDYQVSIHHLFLDQIQQMLGEKPNHKVAQAIHPTTYGVDIMPCDWRISEITTWLQENAVRCETREEITSYWREDFPFFLRNILKQVRSKYDRILIDTPPAFEFNTQTSLLASDFIIIPVELGELEIDGLEHLFLRIVNLKKSYRSNVEILGVVINRYDWGRSGSRTVVEGDLEKSLRNSPTFGSLLFNTIIYRNTAVREAAVLGKLAVCYEKKKARSVRENFDALVEEIELWLARQEVAAGGR